MTHRFWQTSSERLALAIQVVDVMTMVREFGISVDTMECSPCRNINKLRGWGLEQYGIADTFISTLKMEPHYDHELVGVMHGRTHGFLSIEGRWLRLTIKSVGQSSDSADCWDQTQPFMNDTFDWPQWPAADYLNTVLLIRRCDGVLPEHGRTW